MVLQAILAGIDIRQVCIRHDDPHQGGAGKRHLEKSCDPQSVFVQNYLEKWGTLYGIK